MEKVTLSIFVPCFNEEKNIINTLNNIKKGVLGISFEILIVDDASKDNTYELLKNFEKNNPDLNISIIRNNKNKGIGLNFRETAFKANGKYYMYLGGDDSLSSTGIKKTIDNIGKADMVLVYFVDKRSLLRRFLSIMFTNIINLITLNNLKYYNGSNIHLLENVKLFSSSAPGFGYQAELITSQIHNKKTYTEIEVQPYMNDIEKSEALKIYSVLSVLRSMVVIFVKQIIYFLKKIF
jgi:glycosyltransferase involved in cell wall biosynthesis